MNEFVEANIVDKKIYVLVNRDEPTGRIVVKIEARKSMSVPRHPEVESILLEILLQAERERRMIIPVMAGGRLADSQPKFAAVIKNILALPKPIGRFVFDVLGRHEVADLSSIILGWVVVSMTILLFRGFIPLDILVNWVVSLGSSFLR